MKNRTDTLLLIATALFVGGLAVVAGAISFAHMRELQTLKGQGLLAALATDAGVGYLQRAAPEDA
jgi:hypothetical protein